MYSVLVVDDEPIFLEFMNKIIDWNAYKCIVCAKAEDGREALEIIRDKKPDIIFMDINMSEMNGLEVCDEIKEWPISPRIIITTAHNEFQFAHKAIKLKVFDYLLKPFDKNELTSTLEKCIKDIEKEDEFKQLQKNEDTHHIESYFKNAIEMKTVVDTEPPIDFNPATRFAVAMIRYDIRNPKMACIIKNTITGINERGFIRSYSVGVYSGMPVIVHVIDNVLIQIDTLKRWYRDIFQKHPGIECECISLSDFTNSVGKLGESYQQAIICMENSVKMTGLIVSYDSVEGYNSNHALYTVNDVNILIRCFEAKEYDRADIIIEKIFGISENQVLSFLYILSVYNSLTVSIYSHFNHNNNTSHMTSYLKTQTNIVQELNICSTTKQVFEVVKNYIYEIFSDCMDFQISSKKDILVSRINKYLEKHYMEAGLSVDQIAAELFFENSYIRRVYKTQSGKTIMQQLEEIRIIKAKQLLKETQYKLSEIADNVGFSDQFYFSKRFKLFCNLTPSEYQAMHTT